MATYQLRFVSGTTKDFSSYEEMEAHAVDHLGALPAICEEEEQRSGAARPMGYGGKASQRFVRPYGYALCETMATGVKLR